MDGLCTLLRRDILQRHKDSDIHKETELLEATRLASAKDGGLKQILSVQVVLQKKVVLGCLKCTGWQKRRYLIQLSLIFSKIQLLSFVATTSINLILKEMPEQTIRELLQCLSKVIEEKILQE